MDISNISAPSSTSANAITKYDDTLIQLANARCEYKNSIVKYYAKLKEVELQKLRRMTFREINPTICDTACVTFEPQPNQITKQFSNAAKVHEDTITKSKYLSEEITGVRGVVEKLKKERPTVKY